MKKFTCIKDKNILITGITGFIGSNLSKKLQELGANVIGISRTTDNDNIFKIDINDFLQLNNFIKDKKINICFHLAGESIVESGQKNPHKTFQSNISGTLNVLESARENNLEKIVISSTAHVYGDHTPPCSEIDIPQPSRPYETSKLCVDLIAQSYAKTFGLPIFIPRFVNIYGVGDNNFNRLIPLTIKNIILNKNPKMWGGLAVRSYLYIDDAVNAYISLACVSLDEIKNGIIFNFGSDTKISVEDLINKIIIISKKDLKINKIYSGRENEIVKQYVSWEKAKRILDWSPETDLNEGLKITYQWYKNQLTKKGKNDK